MHGATYAGLEIVGKLAAVLSVEPADLLMVPQVDRPRARRGKGGGA
jgi:hypothetical protein